MPLKRRRRARRTASVKRRLHRNAGRAERGAVSFKRLFDGQMRRPTAFAAPQ